MSAAEMAKACALMARALDHCTEESQDRFQTRLAAVASLLADEFAAWLRSRGAVEHPLAAEFAEVELDSFCKEVLRPFVLKEVARLPPTAIGRPS